MISQISVENFNMNRYVHTSMHAKQQGPSSAIRSVRGVYPTDRTASVRSGNTLRPVGRRVRNFKILKLRSIQRESDRSESDVPVRSDMFRPVGQQYSDRAGRFA